MSTAIGAEVPGFQPPPAPDDPVIAGDFVTLERLDATRHAADLFDANRGANEVWDYLGYGPFDDLDSYRRWQDTMAAGTDPVFYAMRDHRTGRIGGVASFLRIDRANGVIEIGHIQIAPAMQRTPASSEAIMLMIRWVFEAGYRRVEWKCNDLNAPSMRAAERYGFTYEGTFRNHMIVKGRNRDTAWWAITDAEWPGLDRAYRRWLDRGNFDADGSQKVALGTLVSEARAASCGRLAGPPRLTSTGCPSTRAG